MKKDSVLYLIIRILMAIPLALAGMWAANEIAEKTTDYVFDAHD